MTARDVELKAADAGTGLTVDVRSVGFLLSSESLRIPAYQRPYKWSVRNVAQLIDDIDSFRRFERYRIGSIIVHQNEGRQDIVDGQQRFLTFCLIAKALAAKGISDITMGPIPLPLLGREFSARNLRASYEYVVKTLGSRDESQLKGWADYFFNRCEVVLVGLSSVDEAFQMFDSQNSRGRPLYPTDLLKAFHIREMSPSHTSEQSRLEMVVMWEEIPAELVHELFHDYLFPIKQWCNGDQVPWSGFATEHVHLFKGIRESDIDRNAKNRWALPFLYAKNYSEDFSGENAALIRYGVLPPVEYPFQIDQPVMNGETFFRMVRHYYDLGLRLGLFQSPSAPTERDAFPELIGVLDSLAPHHKKSTHRYVRNLFDCLLLYYVDRFGDQDLSEASDLIARFAMALRVRRSPVRFTMINSYALGLPLNEDLPVWRIFQDLRRATRSEDVVRRSLPAPALEYHPELHFLFSDKESQ